MMMIVMMTMIKMMMVEEANANHVMIHSCGVVVYM